MNFLGGRGEENHPASRCPKDEAICIWYFLNYTWGFQEMRRLCTRDVRHVCYLLRLCLQEIRSALTQKERALFILCWAKVIPDPTNKVSGDLRGLRAFIASGKEDQREIFWMSNSLSILSISRASMGSFRQGIIRDWRKYPAHRDEPSSAPFSPETSLEVEELCSNPTCATIHPSLISIYLLAKQGSWSSKVPPSLQI